MKRTRSTLLTLLAVLLSPMAANADLIDFGGLTLDDSTGLEWLDVSLTTGLSYNQVLGGSYVVTDGYRFATEAEVFGLMTSAGGTPTTNTTITAGNAAGAQLLLDLMGCTSVLVGRPCNDLSEYWFTAMWGASSQYIALVDVFDGSSSEPSGALATRWTTHGSDDSSYRADVGSFLVRSATVPEPGTLALFGIGLLGMAAARRRRKA